MKKFIPIAIGLSLFSSLAIGVGGIGDVVSDPTSYTYYAQQLKNDVTKLANQAKQLATQNQIFITTKEIYTTGKDTYDTMNEVRDNLEGNYLEAQWAYNRLQDDIDLAQNDPLKFADKVFKRFEKQGGTTKPDDLTSEKLEEGIKEEIDIEYEKGKNQYRNIHFNNMKNEAMKNAMARAELVSSQIGKISADNDENFEKATRANQLKAALDLNNQLLVQLARIQTKQLDLQAKMILANAAQNYNPPPENKKVSLETIENSNTAEKTDYTPIFKPNYSGDRRSTSPNKNDPFAGLD